MSQLTSAEAAVSSGDKEEGNMEVNAVTMV